MNKVLIGCLFLFFCQSLQLPAILSQEGLGVQLIVIIANICFKIGLLMEIYIISITLLYCTDKVCILILFKTHLLFNVVCNQDSVPQGQLPPDQLSQGQLPPDQLS